MQLVQLVQVLLVQGQELVRLVEGLKVLLMLYLVLLGVSVFSLVLLLALVGLMIVQAELE